MRAVLPHPPRLAPMVLGLAGLVGAALAPAGLQGPTICPFALLTGTACPGCGMSRALVALVRGDAALAVGLHPLAPLILVQVVAAFVWWMRRSPERKPLPTRLAVWVLAVDGVLLLGVWAGRLASGSLPPV